MANHNGSVVISAHIGNGDTDFTTSGGLGQMVLRADGNIYITNTSEVAPFDIGRQINTSSGAYLTFSGVWTNSSDRDRKENFAPVNGADVLDKISELPISEWNYKVEDQSVKHIGPVAQDFYEAFGLGGDDKAISTIDPSGVALAGMKEIIGIIKKQSEQIELLERKIARLESGK